PLGFLIQRVCLGTKGWAIARSQVRVFVVWIILCKIRAVLWWELVDGCNQLIDSKWFCNVFVLIKREKEGIISCCLRQEKRIVKKTDTKKSKSTHHAGVKAFISVT